MHKFAYVGDGKYKCRNCGADTDKEHHSEAIKENCPGAALPDRISRQVTAIAKEQLKIAQDVAVLTDRINKISEVEK